MSPGSGLKTFLGLRHVIEDGLNILGDGNDIDHERRNYVLNDLATLLHEASRGFELVEHSSLFVSSDDKNALETYSLLDRYFGYAYSDEWKNKLHVTEKIMQQLLKNNNIANDEHIIATGFLTELLDNLKRRGSKEIPNQPQEIRL